MTDSLQDCHLLWIDFPDDSRVTQSVMLMSIPRSEDRFGLFRFRSPLLTESLLLSFPLVTEMFQFARFAPSPYAFR